MKLHLINAPNLPLPGIDKIAKGELGETMFPPLSTLYLAAQVRSKIPKIEIKITDGLLLDREKTIKELDSFGGDIIGISTATVNATGAYNLATWIKNKSPNTLVVLGGVHATSQIEDTLRRSRADFVAFGEGEDILLELVKCFLKAKNLDKENYRHIKGVAFLQKNKVIKTTAMPVITNLDSLPFPARDLINIKDYHGWPVSKKGPQASIFSARGCPFDCHFCSNELWKLQKPFLRLRTPQNIMDEVGELTKTYGFGEYFEQADELNSSFPWALAYCQEKIKRKLDIPWKAQIRADKMTRDLAKLLAKSNCWYVHLGIESGNQKTLDGVGKYITLEQVINCCKLLKEQNITICGLFMLFNVWVRNGGLEFESVEDSRNTLKFAEKLLSKGLIDNMTCSQAIPYPGSELYSTAIKYNLIPKKYQGKWEYWNHVWSFVMRLPKITKKEMIMVRIDGSILMTKYMIKTGNIPLNNLPFLITRGLGVIKRLIWTRLSSLRTITE